MTTLNVSRVLQANLTGDAKALALKVFSGEVLTAYDQARVASRYVRNRQITAGRSAQFPVLGTSVAEYHTPGTELAGNTVASNEVVISIDDLLISHTSIANYDEAMSHFDVRSEYSTQMGRALANTEDRQLLQLGILAARSSARITGESGGSVITAATAATDSDVLIASLFSAAQKFDEKDVPQEDRVAFLKPAQYYLLAQNTKVLNKDWGGAGVYADGKVLRVAGLEIVMTNHLPTATVANGSLLAGSGNTYAGLYNTNVSLVLQRSALGSVTLMDLAMDSEYSARHQATFMAAKFAKGYGILNPMAAVEIRSGTPT